MLTVNVALAVPFVAISPKAIGKLPGAVIVGEHDGPEICLNVKPWSCVVYAGPTLPLVAVIVTARVSRSPGTVEAVNVIP